jgi:translation elongation factor P/translation initiation factor 5A
MYSIEPITFEQYSVPAEVMGDDKFIWMKTAYRIKFYDEKPVGVTLPKSIVCTV